MNPSFSPFPFGRTCASLLQVGASSLLGLSSATAEYSVLGTMIYCDKNFGADGLSLVPVGDGRWIAITVAVKSSSVFSTTSTEAVGVPSVVENCGTASFCNGYRRRPKKLSRKLEGGTVTTPRQDASPSTVAGSLPVSGAASGICAGAGRGAGGGHGLHRLGGRPRDDRHRDDASDHDGIRPPAAVGAVPLAVESIDSGDGGTPAYDANALPVKFGGAVNAKGLKAVQRLVDSKRLAGFLRLQVVVPRAGKRSAFKRVPSADGRAHSSS
jgi:hypothetical protein